MFQSLEQTVPFGSPNEQHLDQKKNGVQMSSVEPTNRMWWEVDSENPKVRHHEMTQWDTYKDLSIPKHFESPYIFDQYGSQDDTLNPLYRTTSSDYGYYPPCQLIVPHRHFPKLIDHLQQSEMFQPTNRMWWEKDSENQNICEHEMLQSNIYKDLNFPKRFESPYVFDGYGSQDDNLNPSYRTSNSDYGYYPPYQLTVPHKYIPKSHEFTGPLHQCGMFRNYCLNTGMDCPYCDI